ncbi:hypothetical protein [Bacillus kexueae]|nr:hypothetical protein [Bacillus kexueae]
MGRTKNANANAKRNNNAKTNQKFVSYAAMEVEKMKNEPSKE